MSNMADSGIQPLELEGPPSVQKHALVLVRLCRVCGTNDPKTTASVDSFAKELLSDFGLLMDMTC